MKSNTRLTKQGIPDLNYYGPRRKPVAPIEETPATEEVASPRGDAAQVSNAHHDTDAPPG